MQREDDHRRARIRHRVRHHAREAWRDRGPVNRRGGDQPTVGGEVFHVLNADGVGGDVAGYVLVGAAQDVSSAVAIYQRRVTKARELRARLPRMRIVQAAGYFPVGAKLANAQVLHEFGADGRESDW